MSFNLLLESILPARSFLEKIVILLENKTLYEEFDIELKNLLKTRIEDNNGKLNKKELPAIYKSINKKYGISIPKFVKYFDSMLNFYEKNDEITLISCFNNAKTFDSLILPDLSKEVQLKVNEGEFDFEIIYSLSYKYIEYITPKIDSKNFSKYVDLVYESENIKVYMPLTNVSFKYVLSLTKKDLNWCTRNASTWIKYNKKFACMIAVINNESFQLPEDYSVISLKVNYGSGDINKSETCDRFNKHMESLVDNIPEIVEIESACKNYLQENSDLKDRITGRSYYDKEFLIDLFRTKNYKLLAMTIQSIFIGDDENLTAIGNLEDTLSEINSIIDEYKEKYKSYEDIEENEDVNYIEDIKKINFGNVLSSSLVLAIPEIFYLDIIDYHDYMTEFCDALNVELGDVFDEIVGIAESTHSLKYVYTALCYNDSFGNERIDLNERLSMLVEVLNQNNPNLYDEALQSVDVKELSNTTDYKLISKLFDTKYFYNLDYDKNPYSMLIEAFLILDKKNMLHLIDKEKISNIDKGLFITGNFNLQNYNIDLNKYANILYNDLLKMYKSSIEGKEKIFIYGEKAIININKSPTVFETVSNIVIQNKKYKLFIVYANVTNRSLTSKFINNLDVSVLKEIKSVYEAESEDFKIYFNFVSKEINKILPEIPSKDVEATHVNFSEKELDELLKSNQSFSIDTYIDKSYLCKLLSRYLEKNTALLINDQTIDKSFSKKLINLIEFLCNSISIKDYIKYIIDFIIINGSDEIKSKLADSVSNHLKLILNELIDENIYKQEYIYFSMI